MYLLEKLEDQPSAQARAGEEPPRGPAFEEGVVSNTKRMEVWGSDFADSGPDFRVFRVFDGDDKLLAERQIELKAPTLV